MLNAIANYQIHPEYGVLHQIERQPFNYNADYVNAYDELECDNLSKLRFDTIAQTIGRKPQTVLDVGYANGAFLKYANGQGVFTYGLDVTPVDPPVPTVRVSSFKGFYDVITLFDSLEHLDDIGFVRDLDCGYVVISVPCCKDSDFTPEWFTSWKHRKPNEHLWFFTPATLRQFMTRMGYETIGLSNVEDAMRTPVEDAWNIVTGIFRKKYDN